MNKKKEYRAKNEKGNGYCRHDNLIICEKKERRIFRFIVDSHCTLSIEPTTFFAV